MVNGHELMVHRSGEGNPPVVFLPGAGMIGYDFLNLQQRAAEFTTSVVYDRGGTGWSDPIDLPRTPTAVVEELRELLTKTGITGPYTLVGHSLGAFYARRFAQLHPDEVAGLVLLDPGHEDILTFLPPEAAELNERMKPDLDNLPELTQEQIEASRAALTQLYATWPDDIRGPLVERKLATWRAGVREVANFETEVYDELRNGGPLPDVPLIVITAMGANPYWAQFAPPELIERTQEGVRTMHAAIAKGGEHRILADAQHQTMHIQHPDEMITAIRGLGNGT
jgi:pimeloyl-ACP methyl ester carboxylesterase